MMSQNPCARDPYVEYLKSALPETDLAQADEAFLRSVSDYARSIRTRSPWGASIPEDIFRLYVLFPRVNNERLTFYHERLGGEILPRIRGLSMREAALEVNYWCYEMASYRSTSARTASPGLTINAGFGRCGEESTLAVSAMRAAGIPARQVYVPRWAHCDDNHAWIEVYVDGLWHYMGACEPEPVLDSGWFTAAASKAMLVHTRAYGMPPENERIETVCGRVYEVNRTAAYAPATVVTVRVLKAGRPCPGLSVLFELCNMAEFFPICEKLTDEGGRADLLTGFGDIRVRVIHGGGYTARILDVRAARVLEIALDESVQPEPSSFGMKPPAETRIQPEADNMASAHQKRLMEAARLRENRIAAEKTGDPYGDRAGGNAPEILAFMNDSDFEDRDKRLLLDSLPEKDFYDIDRQTLADALLSALPHKGAYPGAVWKKYVLCPRVDMEERLPIRTRLKAALPACSSADQIWATLRERVAVRVLQPEAVFPDSLTALQKGFTSRKGLDVLFVDAMRAMGIPARLSPMTGEKEVFEGGAFVPLVGRTEERGTAVLVNETGETLVYAQRFTVSRVEAGRDRKIELEGALEDEMRLTLRPGTYHLTAVTRQIDGSIDGNVTEFQVFSGAETRVSVSVPPDATRAKLLRVALPEIAARTMEGECASLPGAGGIVAFIEPGEEPTEHFLDELNALKSEFARRGIPVTVAADDAEKLRHPRVLRALAGFPGARARIAEDRGTLRAWHGIMRCGDIRRPFAVAADAEGRGLFAFSNYNVGSVSALMNIVMVNKNEEEAQ